MLRYALVRVFSLGLVVAALALQQVTGQQVCTLSEGRSATVAQCLENPRVTSIVLESNWTLRENFNQSAPVQINRNVTLQGPSNISPDERPVFDMQFVYGAVELCSTCIFTLTNLVIKNDLKGSGPAYDMFIGKPGSKVRSVNTYRLRPACTAADIQLKLYNSLPRSKLFPNSDTPQGIRLKDIVYKGQVYADSVWADYSSFEAPVKFDEARGSSQGGYAAMAMNSSRLCQHYVSKQCLAAMNADACINQLIDSLQAPAPAPSGVSPTAAVAIAVPLVAGFLLAAGVAAWWFKRRYVQRKAAATDGIIKPSGAGPHGPLLTHRTTGASSSSSEVLAQKGSAARSVGKPLGRTSGWEVLDSQTALSVGLAQDDSIKLGAFIGAGSFGKVYKGRWNNMDVAVKVVEHSGSSAAAVEQETDLMMSFQHPNVVRAYHCVHYVHTLEDDQQAQSEVSSVTHAHLNTAVSRCSTSCTPTAKTSLDAARRAADAGSSSGVPALAVAAAAAANTHSTPLGNRSSSGAAAAAAAGSNGPHPEASGDAAITIPEAAACRYGHPSPCQCCAAGSSSIPAAAAPTTPAGAVHRVHFDEQQHSFDAGSMSSASTYMTAASTHAGSGSCPAGRGAGLVLPATDSMGSSIDCKCVAGPGPTSPSSDMLRRSRSLKESSKRFESWLVLEYCDRGCLSNYMAQWPAPCEAFDDDDQAGSMLRALQLLLDTAKGLEELHRHKVVHGDLNARNVLVASCDEAAFGVQGKLADLGLSRTVKQHQTHRTTNTIGTMNHMPPEMLRSGKMSVYADIYALGIMMWELYTGEDAFQRLQHPGQFFETVVLQNLRPVTPEGMPADYQLLMQSCWATQPSARPSITSVVDCLQCMIRERQQQQHQQQQAAAAGTNMAAGSGAPQSVVAAQAMPQLLAAGLQRTPVLGSEMRGTPPATSGVSSQVVGASGSDTLLPLINIDQQAGNPQPPQGRQQQQLLHPSAVPEHAPPEEDAAQSLHAARPDAAAGGLDQRHSGPLQPHSNDVEAASNAQGAMRERVAGGGSTGISTGNSKSAKLAVLLGDLSSSTRQESLEFGDATLERDPSWSTRQGSQNLGGIGHTAWFV